ncbi:MAG: hypothetical protein ACI93T_003921, partial [Porticoccaceae bacterium]
MCDRHVESAVTRTRTRTNILAVNGNDLTGSSTLAPQEDDFDQNTDDQGNWQPSQNPLFRVPDLLP